MQCPNKNSQEWKDLMARYKNETLATIHYFKSGNISAATNVDIKVAIKQEIAGNEEEYATRYSSYLNPIIGNTRSLDKLVEAFALRFDGLNAVIKGDVVETRNGNMLLFPEASEDYRTSDNVPTAMDHMLNMLSRKFNIPFRVIHEPNQRWEGKYVNDGDKKVVIINTAFATPTTPLHEYYHPFVRSLKLRNESLFNSIYSQAYTEGDTRKDEEEVVTSYLEKKAQQRKPNTYLEQFWEFIKKILRIPSKNTIDSATTLKDVFDILDKGTDLSKENTLTKAYKKVDILIDDIETKIGRATKVAIDYIEKIKANNPNLVTDDSTHFYRDAVSGENVATRLTTFVGDKEYGEFSVKAKRFANTWAEQKAIDYFLSKGVDVSKIPIAEITQTIKEGDKEITFKEVLAKEEADLSKGRVYGKMIHAFMQYQLETNVEGRRQAKEQALKYAKEYGEPFYTLETHRDLKKIVENLDSIVAIAGLTLDLDGTSGIPKNKLDRIAPEVILKSSLLVDKSGNFIATTADGITQHANGDLSLLDWKTGGIASDMNSPYLMKYGEKFDITDSKLSRGYLELAFRALILKEQFPDVGFRNIKIVKIDRKGNAQSMALDLQPYLYTIGAYYKANHPQIYAELEKRKLLDATTYEGMAAPLDSVLDNIRHLPYDEQVAYLKTKLSSLHKGRTKVEIERDTQTAKVSAVYADALLELEKLVGTDMKSKTNDIPTYPFIGGFKNFSDISNPRIQTLHKVMMEAKDKITKANVSFDKEHNHYYEKLVKSDNAFLKKSNNFIFTVGLVTGLATFNPYLIGVSILSHNIMRRYLNQTTRQHFGFMWRESSDQGKKGFFMNLANTYLENGVEKEMTKAQIEYRDYVKSSMAKAYDKFAYTIVGFKDAAGVAPKYRYEDLGLPSEMPEDFMPRIPKDLYEIREEEGFLQGFMGVKTALADSWKRTLTSFIEDNYEDKESPIPLKYFKHEGSPVVISQAHSFNVEASFKNFMASMNYKEEMDPIYDLAIGTSNALREEYDENGNARYPNLTRWLDDEIYPQILSKNKDVTLTSKRWNKKMGKIGSMITGIPEGTPYVMSQDRLLRFLKTSVTYSVMSFKVFAPLRNAVMIGLANMTQATRQPVNILLSKIIGVPADSFEGIKIQGASAAVKDYVKAKMFGNEDDSKLWQLAKKFDWLPDNFAYQVNNERLLSKAIQLSPTSHAFMFYNLGETFGALWQLAGIMQGTKIQDKDGNEVSMWDAYDDKGEWKLGSRGLLDKGNGIVEDLTELTALEVKSMKRAYEKLNGSYHKDEKTALEATVIGDFVLQFHKYFYQYLKVLYADPYKDITVGKNVMIGKRPDGTPVYQWHSDIMEGQMRVLVGSLGTLARTRSFKELREYLKDTDKYGANTLKGHRARALGAAINTGLWFMFLSWVIMSGLDDDDKKSYIGKAIDRTLLDLTRNASPYDLLDTIEKPFVAVDRIAKTGKAFFDLMLHGVEGQKTSDGWPVGGKTVLRALPFGAGAMQMHDAFENKQQEDEYIFGIIPVR